MNQETQTDKATELTRAHTADKMRGTDYYECHIYRDSMGFGAGRGETPEEAIKAADDIVRAVNQSQYIEAMGNLVWYVGKIPLSELRRLEAEHDLDPKAWGKARAALSALKGKQ